MIKLLRYLAIVGGLSLAFIAFGGWVEVSKMVEVDGGSGRFARGIKDLSILSGTLSCIATLLILFGIFYNRKADTHVRCPDCKEFVYKEANVCKHCGRKLIPQ